MYTVKADQKTMGLFSIIPPSLFCPPLRSFPYPQPVDALVGMQLCRALVCSFPVSGFQNSSINAYDSFNVLQSVKRGDVCIPFCARQMCTANGGTQQG